MRRALHDLHIRCLDQRIDGERATRLFLAIETMAAMHEQRFSQEAILNLTAGTGAGIGLHDLGSSISAEPAYGARFVPASTDHFGTALRFPLPAAGFPV
jgi:hypothetical protein